MRNEAKSQPPGFNHSHNLPVVSVPPCPLVPEPSFHLPQIMNLLSEGSESDAYGLLTNPPFEATPSTPFPEIYCQLLSFWGFYKSKLRWFSVLPPAGLEFSFLGSAIHFAHCYLHCNFQYFFTVVSYFPCPCGLFLLKVFSVVILWDVRKTMKVNNCFSVCHLYPEVCCAFFFFKFINHCSV